MNLSHILESAACGSQNDKLFLQATVFTAQRPRQLGGRQNDSVLGAAGAATGGAVLAAHQRAVEAGEEAAQALSSLGH